MAFLNGGPLYTTNVDTVNSNILSICNTTASKLNLGRAAITTEVLGTTLINNFQIYDTSSTNQYIWGVNELTANRTITLPLLTGNDTFTFLSHAQTLTNKTLDSTTNIISADNIHHATGKVSISSSTAPTAGQILRVTTGGASAVATWQDEAPAANLVKDSVRVASIANVSLASTLDGVTVDGVTLVAGNRVLLKNQTTGLENGIYDVVISPGLATRSSDFALTATVANCFLFSQEGTINADAGWVVTNNSGSDIVGTNIILFLRFSGAGTDHGTLTGLSNDDHTQYALLAGRSGGQTIIGGTLTTQDLTIRANVADLTTGTIAIPTTTTSTTSGTGALVVQGGVGIVENINVGGTATITGLFTLGNLLIHSSDSISLNSSLSEIGNPSASTSVTFYTITGGSGISTGTLSDGTNVGEQKTITIKSFTSGSLLSIAVGSLQTPSAVSNRINFSYAGQSIILLWDGANWNIMHSSAEITNVL